MYETILTKDFLTQEYVVSKKTKARIAREVGVTITTLHKYFCRHGITRNPHSDYASADLKGLKVGRLEAMSRGPNDKHNKVRWHCKCECGRVKLINAASLIRRLSASCGCLSTEIGRRNGYQDISYSYWRRLRQSAEGRDYEFSITPEYLWGVYIAQGRKCALSGLPVVFYPNSNYRHSQTASVDRINPSLGYVEGNVQIVHKTLNLMKSFLGHLEFIGLCNLVAATHPVSAEEAAACATRAVLKKETKS